jgi:large subunit ribosomal protein L37Ae
MTKTKIAGSAGRFGPRYGVSVRRRTASIEAKQRKKQKCPYCGGRIKRLSKGIWLCNKCKKKFAGHTYYLEQTLNPDYKPLENTPKALKKENKDTSIGEAKKKSSRKGKK